MPQAAQNLIAKMPAHRLADLVLQRGVADPHVLNGHKWCMRWVQSLAQSFALGMFRREQFCECSCMRSSLALTGMPAARCGCSVHVLEVAGAPATYPDGAQCWLHDKIICLPHARPYVHGDLRKDAWVQQIGKSHPQVRRAEAA